MDGKNNIGAISALRGYRSQFLYSLSRILAHAQNEGEYHPEGKFEDLDIYNENKEVIEVIQIKHLSDTLTLSNILSRKQNNFIKRAIQAYLNGYSPAIKLISFGPINQDIIDLASGNYSVRFCNKLRNLGVAENEIEILKANFTYEVVDEETLENRIEQNIVGWGAFSDFKVTLELLTYWVYKAAEQQLVITSQKFKEQFEKVCKFETERTNFYTSYGTLIMPLVNDLNGLDYLHLREDFYKGISANYYHILAKTDVIREDKLKSIESKFESTNIIFIHGASGQGKSTLSYRYLFEYCSDSTVFELKLSDDITLIRQVIVSLEGISKGILFPITIFIDVDPGKKEWVGILKELAARKNFRFLISIREEDWNSLELGDKFQYNELELKLEEQEAGLIYNSLNAHRTNLKFVNFEDAWGNFGGNGPLLEFVYLVTQSESLSSKLKSQISSIQKDASDLGKEKLKILRYTTLVDSYGGKIKLKSLSNIIQNNIEIAVLVELLQNEYLVRLSTDKQYITGLHPLRSRILKGFLFDGEINIESDFILQSLHINSENSNLTFLRNAFRYGNLLPDKLIAELQKYNFTSWQGYLSILRALLWKGIDDYIQVNSPILDKVYSEYNQGWAMVTDFDFSGIIEEGGLMKNSDVFSEEQRKYAVDINQNLTDKQNIFVYCKAWISQLDSINIVPDSGEDWDAFSLFLFWLDYFERKEIVKSILQVRVNSGLENSSIEIISQVLYVVRKYNGQEHQITTDVEAIFHKQLSEKHGVLFIDILDDKIECKYLVDILDFDNNISVHERTMTIVRSLRFAYPDKGSYWCSGAGHLSFVDPNYDDSIKRIKRENLPLKPLVELNYTYFNLFNYYKRLSDWNSYVNRIIEIRKIYNNQIDSLNNSFKLYHSKRNSNSLRDYILDYDGKKEMFSSIEIPLLPQNVSDEWGGVSDDNPNQKTDNFFSLSGEKYKEFTNLLKSYGRSVSNFLSQSSYVIVRKLTNAEDFEETDRQIHVSLVANLYKGYEELRQFQKAFRLNFEKYIDPPSLIKIEKDEIRNITMICFLYRQFTLSGNFIAGNVENIALKKVSDTHIQLKSKIVNGFKKLSKEIRHNIQVTFEEDLKQCTIVLDQNENTDVSEWIKLIYDKLVELIEKPNYKSLKYLALSTNYPTFNILVLISGKTLNNQWLQFNSDYFISKSSDDLKAYELVPADIPNYFIRKENLKSWSDSLVGFEKLHQLMTSCSTVHQLAFHIKQLKAFIGLDIPECNRELMIGHLRKVGKLFSENWEKGTELFGYYFNQTETGGIEFFDDNEELEFIRFLLDNHRNFYPSDIHFEQKNLNITVDPIEMEEWFPRLEKLVHGTYVLHNFLAGKIIGGKAQI